MILERIRAGFLARSLIIGLVAALIAAVVAVPAQAVGSEYYVSPIGSDTNPGTEEQPWRTFAKAAATLQAGDTAIFEDGVYQETAQARFVNSGTASAPITVKARNKHQAVLKYSGVNTTVKIVVSKSYITIQDFEITQETKGTGFADAFIDNNAGANNTYVGNKIHGAFGRAISSFTGENVVVAGNAIYNIDGQGVFLSNVDSPIVRDNDISEVGNTGIYAAHGTRSAQIYNNHVHANSTAMSYGMLLGGTTSATGAYDPEGFEAYNLVAWNNTIIAEVAGRIQSGVTFAGSTDSAFYNNVVVGAQYGVRTMNGGGSTAGWMPVTTNATVKNNIFAGVTARSQLFSTDPVNFVSDYNLYFSSAQAPTEEHGVYADPKFADAYTDLNLQWDSPAIGAGAALTFTGHDGEPIDISLDAAGEERVGDAWNLGVYATALPKPVDPTPTATSTSTPTPNPTNPETDGPVLFSEDFESGDAAWTPVYGTMGIIEETPGGNKVFTDPNATPSTGVSVSSAGSVDWESYAVDMRVNFTDFFATASWLTLYGRRTDNNNYYLVEMKGDETNGYIGMKRLVDGVPIPLRERIDFHPTPGWHDLKLIFNGVDIEFWMDGEQLLKATDYKLSHGYIAAGIYRSNIMIDDLVVREIDAASVPQPPTGPLPEPGGTYYVSPTGDDDNPGTEEAPWKTMAFAASVAQRGNTIIFEDGLYNEDRVAFVENSGTETEPIVFKARNKRKAVIKYHSMPTSKIYIRGKEWITLQDFVITQDERGFDTNDILVRVIKGSHHVRIIGNEVYNCFEDGIKGNLIHDYVVDGNYIHDVGHEGIDFVNNEDSVIRNNEVYDAGRVGIMVKGGTQDVAIYNNYIHNRNVGLTYAMTIGGSTDPVSTRDPSLNGFEAWNLVAYNNVIVSEVPGLMDNGISFLGAKDSAAYNNVVSGAKHNLLLLVPNNLANKWAWNPQNVNVVVKNNIFLDATVNALYDRDGAINLTHDHNLYFGNATEPAEAHGVYDVNPTLADVANGDAHLAYGSPAVGAGTAIDPFPLFDGVGTIDVSHDGDGVQREASWDIGAYQYIPYVNPNPELFIAGASSAAIHPESIAPLTSWGMAIAPKFDSAVTMRNYAKSGTSSKSFWDSGLVGPIQSGIGKGDYLFIQFGHNDQTVTDPARYTDPDTTYKEYLTKYVELARAHGAIPVLINPQTRRVFAADGSLKYSLGEYPRANRELAQELNAPLIELYLPSRAHVSDLGPELSKKLYHWLEPGEHPNWPNGAKDDTHFSPLGAEFYSNMVLDGITSLDLPLAEHINYAPIVAPVTTAEVTGELDNGWYTSNATVALSAVADSRSEIARTQYQLAVVSEVAGVSTPATEGWAAYADPVVLTDGVYDVSYRSQDYFGHWEESKTLRVMVDSTGATSEATLSPGAPQGSNGWYTSEVTLSLEAEDLLSGLDRIEYQVNRGTWSVYTDAVAFSDGVYAVNYRAVDKAGNVEATQTVEFKVDTTAPEMAVTVDKTVIFPPNFGMETITASLDSSDATSGVASVLLTSITCDEDCTEDDYVADLGSSDTTFQVTRERAPAGDGREYTITYTATDNAGNETTATATVTVPRNP